jgi:NTE family protein
MEEEHKEDEQIIDNHFLSQYNFNTLVLSGGGSKGFSMLGALQYLYDKGYTKSIKNYIGTSIGAIIAYLLVIGLLPDEIITFLCTHKTTDKFKHFNLVAMINRQGALNFSPLSEALERITIEKVGYLLTLKDIKTRMNKQLVITTYNLTEDKVEYLTDENHPDLPCLTALRMSANIPLLFEDFKYYNNYYVDGGILANFPIDYFDKDDNIIFGINLKSEDTFSHEDNIAEYFYKLIYIPLNKYTEEKISKASTRCKILSISFKNIKITQLDVNNHKKLEMFSEGYETCKNFFEQ